MQLCRCFCGNVILLATSDAHQIKTKSNAWFTAFSLEKNLRWQFSTSSASEDIEAVHGIRFPNAIMLIFSHKSMTMSESLGQPWTVIGRVASLYTDLFLLFSGILTSYSLFGRLMKQQLFSLSFYSA